MQELDKELKRLNKFIKESNNGVGEYYHLSFFTLFQKNIKIFDGIEIVGFKWRTVVDSLTV